MKRQGKVKCILEASRIEYIQKVLLKLL